MKVIGIRLLLMAFILALFELIVINIAGILPFLAAHKANISSAPFMDFVIENLMNPIGTSTSMIEKKNPLFFIGSGAVIVLSVFMVFFTKGGKGKYELADKYGVHGSSRFAQKHEIFTYGETVEVPIKQLMQDLDASMPDSKGGK
ncbi:hypothetical protein SAMN05878482_10979 [Peribacillus simplex]|uniref:Uncharacterized protein n=1 Tax=Peribacillus simplex TaxID=1478 RepID=A0A9X8RDP2_9BACI|nr:hypothetical protein [Peribacillus simplex]SIS01853.1 hypothetical protein SAMN05878482_10979 [Peribacillus simplex]